MNYNRDNQLNRGRCIQPAKMRATITEDESEAAPDNLPEENEQSITTGSNEKLNEDTEKKGITHN